MLFCKGSVHSQSGGYYPPNDQNGDDEMSSSFMPLNTSAQEEPKDVQRPTSQQSQPTVEYHQKRAVPPQGYPLNAFPHNEVRGREGGKGGFYPQQVPFGTQSDLQSL